MIPHPALLVPRCGHCQGMTSPLRCARCKVQRYCNSQHQALDFSSHESACAGVPKTLQCLNAEEQKLRDQPGNWLTERDPFTTSAGHFWGVIGTSEYMRARRAHVEQLAQIQTHDSIATQLEHIMDCLRLCRSDSSGFRHMAPHLMIRLGRDQEAYDFAKWWETIADRPDYDWGNRELPYLDVKDADCFEDVSYLCRVTLDLSQVVAVCLVKIKMILDLISLQALANSNEFPPHVPAEIHNTIRDFSTSSSIINANREIMASNDQRDRIDKLVRQVKRLYKAVHRANRHFWPTLISPDVQLEAGPVSRSRGEFSEVQQILRFPYHAWMETPGAIEVVRVLMGISVSTGDHLQ